MPKFYSPIRAQPSIAMARAGQTMFLLTAKILSKPIKPIIKFIIHLLSVLSSKLPPSGLLKDKSSQFLNKI